MLKKNLYAILAISMTLVLALSSCDKKEDKPNEGEDLKSVTITNHDISKYEKWYYFSFKTGKFVGEGASDPTTGDDAAWKARTDWDIAFHAKNVRTNSGLSGDGNGGVLDTKTEDYESVTKVPEGTFVTDTKVDSFMTTFDMPPVYIETPANEELGNWVMFDHSDAMQWIIKKKNTYIIRTADGKYAKFKAINFLNEEDQQGFITFKYTYQDNGSTSF